jgi:hypothetical protein
MVLGFKSAAIVGRTGEIGDRPLGLISRLIGLFSNAEASFVIYIVEFRRK